MLPPCPGWEALPPRASWPRSGVVPLRCPLTCSPPFFPVLANEDPCWKVGVPSLAGRGAAGAGGVLLAGVSRGEGLRVPSSLPRALQDPPGQPTGASNTTSLHPLLRTQGPRGQEGPGGGR